MQKDITDLQRKIEILERKNKELESFAYIASHDLQAPLRKINIFSNRILNEDYELLSDKSKDYFSRIIKASGNMQKLIEALLNYSIADSKEQDFEIIPLSDILNEAVGNLNEIVRSKEAVIDFDEDLPDVSVVPQQFLQVIQNILSNSMKYVEKGVKPLVYISVEKLTKDEVKLPDATIHEHEYYWRINFKDNGIGFEEEYKEKIFELFQRLHSKTDYEGTGIGLAICRKVIQNHKGYMNAISKPGEGATFKIYLPVL